MGDWTRQEEHSWPTLDALSWPLRRWVCDRLVGQHAYSRNVQQWGADDLIRDESTGDLYRVTPIVAPAASNSANLGARITLRNCWVRIPDTKPFDQERT